MNKVEQNAIKIAELLGYKERANRTQFRLYDVPKQISRGATIVYPVDVVLNYYSSYDYLMKIIESEISEYELKNIHFELKTDSLLEAVQNFVIRYLELKNG
jgi:hypothetical protein